MGGKVDKPTLTIFNNHRIQIEKVSMLGDKTDYDNQALILCAYLVDVMPTGTVKSFCDMTGIDYDSLVTMGFNGFKEIE